MSINLKQAVEEVNEAYNALCNAIDKGLDDEADIKSDLYENLITFYAVHFGYSYNDFEDICTNVRYFGWDND